MTDPNSPASSSSPLDISQASLDVQQDPQAAKPPVPLAPGDEVAPGSKGAAEGLCRACGGTGRTAGSRQACPECGGSGKVSVGIGGG
jgi:hypothetical protein